jgi:hypothetical protein
VIQNTTTLSAQSVHSVSTSMLPRPGGGISDQEHAHLLARASGERPRQAQRVVAMLGTVGSIVQDEKVFHGDVDLRSGLTLRRSSNTTYEIGVVGS